MAGASILKDSDVTRSTEASIERTGTCVKASESSIAGDLSTQKSEQQARTGRVDSEVDVLDIHDIQKRELVTYPRSS